MKTYLDIYLPPLIQETMDEGRLLSRRITDSKHQFVFQFQFDDEKAQRKILDAINGLQNLINPELSFKHKEGFIVDNKDRQLILIRGWGNLTGQGGHKLSAEEAANVQDTFAEFIVKQLNKR